MKYHQGFYYIVQVVKANVIHMKTRLIFTHNMANLIL